MTFALARFDSATSTFAFASDGPWNGKPQGENNSLRQDPITGTTDVSNEDK